MRSRTPLILVLLLALVAAGCAQAPQGDGHEPMRVLFVGNSLTHTNDLPAVVTTLARGLGTEIEYETIAPGGVSLEDHWNAGRVPAELASGEWDAVVMQQGPSALPESQVNLIEWAERLAELAREHGTRARADDRLARGLPRQRPRRCDRRRTRTRRRPPAPSSIRPVLAWQTAWSRSPSLPLYGPDGFHPSPLGTYLAALVVTAGLTGQPPPAVAFSVDRPRLQADGVRRARARPSALRPSSAHGGITVSDAHRAALSALIDHAPTFPPASLPGPDAYRRGSPSPRRRARMDARTARLDGLAPGRARR